MSENGAFYDDYILNVDGQNFVLSLKVYSEQLAYVREFYFELIELSTSIYKVPIKFTFVESVSLDGEKVYLVYFDGFDKPYNILIDKFSRNAVQLKYFLNNDIILSRFIYSSLYCYFLKSGYFDDVVFLDKYFNNNILLKDII